MDKHPEKLDEQLPEWIRIGLRYADPCSDSNSDRKRAWNNIKRRICKDVSTLEKIPHQVKLRAGHGAAIQYSNTVGGWVEACSSLVLESACLGGMSYFLSDDSGSELLKKKEQYKNLHRINTEINYEIKALNLLAEKIKVRDELAQALSIYAAAGPRIEETLEGLRNKFLYWDAAVGEQLHKFLITSKTTSQPGPKIQDLLNEISLGGDFYIDTPDHDPAFLASQKPNKRNGEISINPFLSEFLYGLYDITDNTGGSKSSSKNRLWITDELIADIFNVIAGLDEHQNQKVVDAKRVKECRDNMAKNRLLRNSQECQPGIFGIDWFDSPG